MKLHAILILPLLSLTHANVVLLTCEQVKAFVDGHNTRRLQVAKGEVHNQPGASVMNTMVWDKELATKAAKWASKHKFAHNPDKTIPSKRFNVGENIYSYSTTGQIDSINPDTAIKAWFDEYTDFQYGPIKKEHFTRNVIIGHYTQMIWSDSTHLGCAISHVVEGKWNKFIIVCNYGPAGNVLGQYPYVSGLTNRLTCEAQNCLRPYGNC